MQLSVTYLHFSQILEANLNAIPYEYLEYLGVFLLRLDFQDGRLMVE